MLYFLLTISLILNIFIAWIYFQSIPYIWEYSILLTSFFSVYWAISLWSIFLFSLWVYFWNSNLLSIFLIIISLINLVWWSYPIYQLYKLAGTTWVELSIIKNLEIKINRGLPQLDKSIRYLRVDWQDLYLDIHETNQKISWKIKPLIMIHGWGFTQWERSQEPEWIEFFNALGYTVFDIEYRLATLENHTWDSAASDVNSAITWLWNNSEKYNLDMSELILAGSSAWWSIAWQAAYGWNEIFPSRISWEYFTPKKIIGYFPAVEMEPLWDQDTQFLNISSRKVGIKYTWWWPTDFPERYDKINARKLATKNAPETLIIHGAADHLIPADTLLPLQEKLWELWVENTFVFIPYAEHGFTYFVWNFWFQIAKWVTKNFLK